MPQDSPEFLKNYQCFARNRIHNHGLRLLPAFSVAELPCRHGSLPNANSIPSSVHGDSGKQKYILEPLLPQKQSIQTELMFQWLLVHTDNYAFFHSSE